MMRITVAHADAAHADAGTMVVAHADAVVHTTARADAAQKNAVHANAVPAVVNLAIAVVIGINFNKKQSKNNRTCGCDSCSCGVVIWGSSGTSGSSGGERIDYSQIQGSGYKGSPKGCADSAATGTAPDTFKDAKNPVNVMNNAFVRGRINMMWDEMTAKVKDNPGIELACCIFYDFDNKEYIGGKFINGTNGQVKLKDFTPQGNGYTGNSQNIKLVTVVHIHPALTYDKGYNARPLGPSPEDIQFVANKKEKQIDFGIVIDYKGKYEDYENKNGEKTEDFIIRSGHPYDAPRQYHIFNDSRDVATGNF
jgi:hypothetical protein